jgi:hypothetical protein
MENNNQAPAFMGMTPEKLARYNREYMRLNPYNLPDIRPKRRRIVRSEFVCSTHEAR